jgi:hypothetical protein
VLPPSGTALKGVFGVGRHALDDLVGKIVASGSLELFEAPGGFFGNTTFVATGDDVNRHLET